MIRIIFVLIQASNCLAFNETLNHFEQVKRYLYEYGYLQMKDNTSLQAINKTIITNTLFLFQEYYKIQADGKQNNETLELMTKPRCGNADNVFDFRTSTFKWNKSVITWHYYLAMPEVLELTKKAFTLWEEKSNIRFNHDRAKPDILISNKPLKHMMQKNLLPCSREFDSKGGIIAHAFFLDYHNSRCKIHIDEDENWSFSSDNISSDQISLFATLIHEIGCTIGLLQSDVIDSVMFSYYNGKIDLAADNILAIENLYGKPKKTDITPTSLLTEDKYVINTNEIDLCHLKNVNTLLITNKWLYILYDKWLWIINSGEMTYSNPIIITDWLTFLPKVFQKF